MKRILSYARRAIEDYKMIDEGDMIAVGVSGGKDSLALLNMFNNLKMFYPKKFDFIGVTLDLGYKENDFSPIETWCAEKNIKYKVVKTNIKEVVFDIRKETNPCSLCAKLRSGAINGAALDLGCNKVALGHHFEDVIETFFLSLFFEGRIHCFSPVTHLDRKGIHLIRPLIYTPESVIRGAATRLEFPICKNLCPADGNTKREEMKEFVNAKAKEDRHFKDRIFNAIQTSVDGWKDLR